MSIDLGRHQSPVSHHAADGLDRHTQRERDMRSEVVPCLVKGHVLYSVDFTQTRNEFLQLLVGAYRQQLFVGAFGSVFLDNSQRYVQQPHDRFRAGLLPSDMYPPHAIFVLCNMFLRQLFQICIRQPCESREDEPVPHPLQFGIGNLLGKQAFQLVEFQVAALALGSSGCSVP